MNRRAARRISALLLVEGLVAGVVAFGVSSCVSSEGGLEVLEEQDGARTIGVRVGYEDATARCDAEDRAWGGWYVARLEGHAGELGEAFLEGYLEGFEEGLGRACP